MNSNKYAILYTKLITDKEYSSLGVREIVLYSLMLDRARLSQKNKSYFCNSKGTFIYYSITEMTKHLRCNRNTAVKTVENLINAGLIEKEQLCNGKPAKYYVKSILGETENKNDDYIPKKKVPGFGEMKNHPRKRSFGSL